MEKLLFMKPAGGHFQRNFEVQKSKLPTLMLLLTITPQTLYEGTEVSIADDLTVTVNTDPSVLNP
jgi:hypothetical protein